ncbi:unnamed protein product [Moneuplotes crassus]|uniref:MORN repeat protein n=1 Tax=Euplotes crassus TaxID=5936 RepID=A0AAD1XPU2_EUPCR|nr:unnamed protein product [Moneuplotes crassus]
MEQTQKIHKNLEPYTEETKDLSDHEGNFEPHWRRCVQEMMNSMTKEVLEKYLGMHKPEIRVPCSQYLEYRLIKVLEDGGKYLGQWDKEMNECEGQGMLVTPSDEVYQGSFSSGVPHGKGIYVFPDESTYQGDVSNGELSGKGVLIRKDGSRCEGEWSNGNIHGFTELTFSNGNKQKGFFSNNRMHGYCKFISSNGDYREGEMSNDSLHGYGYEILHSGDQYFGGYWSGMKHGKGTAIKPDGQMCEGEWNCDEPSRGTFTDSKGREHKFNEENNEDIFKRFFS